MRLRSQGFSLLEAIVAIVLLSSTGIALYSWINSSLMSVNRVRDVMEQQQIVRETLPYIEIINPMIAGTGRQHLGQYELQWDAKLVEDIRDGVEFPDGVSVYQLGLYRVDVKVLRGNENFSYSVRQVGYKKVREFPES